MNRATLLMSLVLIFDPLCPCQAMKIGMMSDPEWFQEAANKLLLLEYDNSLGGSSGMQLTEALGRMALATMTGLDGFAVIILEQENPPLRLTQETVEMLAKRQHCPVVIWGELYEQKGRIFVVSHLRFVADAAPTNAHPLEISWIMKQPESTEPRRATAALPTHQIDFAPITISRDNLESLDRLWNKAFILREAPLDSSIKTGELTRGSPYYVIGATNGWTKLKVREGGEGWVRLGELGQNEAFKESIGVVLFAQGMMQHLAWSTEAPVSFDRYLMDYAPRQPSMNHALAHLLSGFSSYMDSSLNRRESIVPIKQHFEKARLLLPNAASPVNSLAVALFSQEADSAMGAMEAKQLEKDLIRTIKTENDSDAVRNLAILYQLPRAQDYFSSPEQTFMKARETNLGVLRDLEKQFTRRKQ